MYAKNKNNLILNGDEKDFRNYANPDNDPNGDWTSGDPSAKSGGESTYFEIVNPYTNKADLPPKGRFWAFSKDTLKKYIESGKIKFKKEYGDNERGFIFKRYKSELKSIFNPVNSLFPVENEYMNQVGTKEVQQILEGEYFSNPKPVLFIKKLVQYGVSNDDIVLDFFSGSATTAHAVMQLNAEDGGNRKFIMVQLPEPTNEKSEAYKAGYKNICEIGKERIRRAGEKIKEENKDKENIENLDIGFKVFKLDTSNIRKWQPDYDNLEQSLLDYI
ncbi:MAG: site-specific DNA-methyltransferase, partial [Clostridiaceae bacterium]|nr:site-specific DNA-methyltransferase [Clostridiaceae bacterium]